MKHIKVLIYVLQHNRTTRSPANTRQAIVKHDEITEKLNAKHKNYIYKLKFPRNTSLLDNILQILLNKCTKYHCIDLDIDGGTNMCKLLVSFFSVKTFATLPYCVPTLRRVSGK
jgi:hypothetical protein